MKKLLSFILAVVFAAVLVSCSEENNETRNETLVFENVDLVALADSLYESFVEDELPMLMSMEVFAEDFEYFTFIPYVEGYRTAVSEPMMGSIAHSVVIVETPDEATAKSVAEEMEKNANPRKWICVEAEKVVSGTNKNLAILIMSDSKADTILETFKSKTAENIPVLSGDVVTDETLDFGEDENLENEEIMEEVPAYSPEEDEISEDSVVDETEESEENEVASEDESVAEEPEVEVEEPAVEPEVEEPAVEPEVEEPAVEPEVEEPAVEPEVEEPTVEPEVEEPTVEPEVEEPEAEAPAQNGSIDELYVIADKLYNGIDPMDMPMVGTMELTEENFEYSAFVPYKSTYLAVESLPMMGSMPHSVVIVKASSEEEASQLAADMKANANPRKWICVSAKSVKTASKGRYAILVMTSYEVMPEDFDDEAAVAAAEAESNEISEERANLIVNNFLAAV